MVCSLAYVLVGIPNLLPVIFGPQNLDRHGDENPAVLQPERRVLHHVAGTPINGIYLSTISVTVVVLILLTILLRFTSLGLQMRAAVESRRLVSSTASTGTVWLRWPGSCPASWRASPACCSLRCSVRSPLRTT